MTRLAKVTPVLVVGIWYAIAAAGIALAAMSAVEPPVWDSLSYAQKAYTFWQSVHARHLFDPFALPMTVRPPGTILVSYPLGWSDDFRWFYFRTCFIPIGLLIAAVYIAGWSRRLTPLGHWILAGLALALAGMPILFQFQANAQFPAAVYWGLVDGFLAGVSAVAAAAVIRGVTEHSIAWSVFGAFAGGFTLWIKPTGLALMALTGMAWLILLGASLGPRRLGDLWRDAAMRRFAAVSIAGATVVFATVAGLSFFSAYFSPENITFGRGVLAILESEYSSSMTPRMAVATMRISFGPIVPMLFLLGVFAAAPSRLASVIVAALCIFAGVFFYEPGQIRYFLPFGVMAFIFVLPPLLTWLQGFRPRAVLAGTVVAIAPTMVITALLMTPETPVGWQRTMGVSLHTNDYGAENQQAIDFLNQLQREGKSSATVYLSDTTPILRNLVSVWDTKRVTDQPGPRVAAYVPVDWQRASTVRVEYLNDAIAVEFVGDEIKRNAILAQRQVPDFPAEVRLFNAWVSSLGESDGIAVISDTRVRLVRVVDRTRFEAALARLEADHDMRKAYLEANPQRWWSGEELDAQTPRPALIGNTGFHVAPESPTAVSVRGVEVTTLDGGVQVSFWLEPLAELNGPWTLFVHLMDADRNIVGNAQVELPPSPGPFPDRPIRNYRVSYPARPANAVSIAFGIFKPIGQTADFMEIDQDQTEGKTDLEKTRIILPLPASR